MKPDKLTRMQREARRRHLDNPRHAVKPMPVRSRTYREAFFPDPPKPKIIREHTQSEHEKVLAKYLD